jgi:hypothetical protein
METFGVPFGFWHSDFRSFDLLPKQPAIFLSLFLVSRISVLDGKVLIFLVPKF